MQKHKLLKDIKWNFIWT